MLFCYRLSRGHFFAYNWFRNLKEIEVGGGGLGVGGGG